MTKKEREKARLVKELLDAIENRNLAVFAGAGLSIPAGYVNWKQLLQPIADELDLDINREENNLVQLAQYHCNVNQSNRGKINQLLVNEFSQMASLTENHRILARLPVETFWTTNYDRMIESALLDAGKTPDVKYNNKQLAITVPKRDAIVYKMHGDVEHPSEAILTKDDYESYHVKMQPFLNALSGDLISKTFLFLGFSFTDPNLDYILSRVRIAYSRDQRPHYCLLKNLTKDQDESDADFEYRERKQELFIQDLLRFGIKSVMVDEYSEITAVLQTLEMKTKSRSIFISGAANDYAPYEKAESEKFVYELSKDLISSGYRVVSGFGLGIGSSVISGALESLYMSGNKLDDNQLLLRPFPQNQIGKTDLKLLWRKYREDMISYAGIAIFLFGNKLVEGNVILSDGMREEYEIAQNQGLFVVPVGATGSMAEVLWTELKSAIESKEVSFPKNLENALLSLGDSSLSFDEIKKSILEIALTINKGV
ncbi:MULTISPECIES: SIR2 family protein [Vibrio]|uniref:SIR2 family protein n=1 Tax=Vibrio TaxID=662 RepID=UPI001BD43F53|nr:MULTISPECIES: SIR2 family protein [Vibrio]MBS9965039.1 SIR2 family protein [Vibrio alginolyticus]MDW1535873.1 SIR2 family protein [Vibrio sp. Y159]